MTDRPLTTGEGNTAENAYETVRTYLFSVPLAAMYDDGSKKGEAFTALNTLLAECGRLREQLDAARQALDPAAVAESFHAHYERLAPDYGYRTREESAVPWASVPLLNKRLMVATVTEALAAARAALGVEG